MIKIKIKKMEKDAKLPQRQKEGDVGFDAYIHRFKGINEKERKLYNTVDNKGIKLNRVCLHKLFKVVCCLGFATEIPEGYYAQLVPRSGLALWDSTTIVNTPATIDSGYRGEWIVIVISLFDGEVNLEVGDRICQIIFRKVINCKFDVVSKLNNSDRGVGGFGSTGK